MKQVIPTHIILDKNNLFLLKFSGGGFFLNVLEIRELKTYFQTQEGTAKAVDGVSLSAKRGEILGLVGESGCGKSALALSILRLVPQPPAFFAGGQILFEGQDLLHLGKEEMRRLRGNRISMIFQEPMTALNPVFTIGNQLSEVFQVHQGLNHSQALNQSIEMLKMVGVPAPERRIKEYPYQLSGGMRQRVMIAMALACQPILLLADEPTTALDVTIQAQILDLILKLRDEFDTTVVLITHDLGVVAETTERVAVMYTGKIVEEAETVTLFDEPLHPYTQGLLAAIPSVEAEIENRELHEIKGVVPSLTNLPSGCNFAPRCHLRESICDEKEPELVEIQPGHRVACWRIGHG